MKISCGLWCLTFILNTTLLTSCVHCYYSPSEQNVPLFKKKGDKILSATAGGSFDIVDSTIDIQTAWAFSNKFALMEIITMPKGKVGAMSQKRGIVFYGKQD